MLVMPLTFSITNGIGAGFISYVVVKVARGKGSEVHPSFTS
jgi:AGZA family xanthine/uracil permease-like MFS transporter